MRLTGCKIILMVSKTMRTSLKKDLIIGVLSGLVIGLTCLVFRLDTELDKANQLLDDPAIRFPEKSNWYREYERAKQPMPMVPDVDYRIEQMLNLAAEEPSLFSDEEIVYLLIQ